MNIVAELDRVARKWEIVQRLQDLQQSGLLLSQAGVELHIDECREATINVWDWRFDRQYGEWLLAQQEEP